MGQGQSQEENGVLKSKNYRIIMNKENDVYGQFKLIECMGKHYALITKICLSYQDYCCLSTTLNQNKNFNAIPHSIKLLEVNKEEDNNLCSTQYRVHILFEHYDHTLRQSNIFNLQIIKDIVNGLSLLYENNLNHGNVTPDTILINNNNIKLSTIQQITGCNHFKRCFLRQTNRWYLAPELLEQLKIQDIRCSFDVEKSDVFSLALIILELWDNADIQSLYDKQSYSICEVRLEQMLIHFQEKHGLILKNILKQMLQSDYFMRPTFQDLSQYLLPITEQICDVQPTLYEVAQVQFDDSTNNLFPESPKNKSHRGTTLKKPQTAMSINQRSISSHLQMIKPTPQPLQVATHREPLEITKRKLGIQVDSSMSGNILRDRKLNINVSSRKSSQNVSPINFQSGKQSQRSTVTPVSAKHSKMPSKTQKQQIVKQYSKPLIEKKR